MCTAFAVRYRIKNPRCTSQQTLGKTKTKIYGFKCYSLYLCKLSVWYDKCLLDSINLVQIPSKCCQLCYDTIYLPGIVVSNWLAVTIHIHLQFHIIVTKPVDRIVIQNYLLTQHQSLILLCTPTEVTNTLTE